MFETITIQIPFTLARYAVSQRRQVVKYDTNQFIRAMDTWLVLKHLTTAGIIQNWNAQKQDLLKTCKCSESIFRHRMKILADLQLLTFTRYNIKIASWQTLEKIFAIDCTNRFTIQYQTNDRQTVQQWIIAAEIKDNQNRQDFMINKRLKENPDYYLAVLAAILKAGADRSRLKEPGYLETWLKIVYHNDFIRASEIHDLLIEIRPDNNRGVKGIAAAWECRHPVTVSYWKNKLQRSGIIDVSKLQIESQERVRNNKCRVLWLDTKKIRLQYPGRQKKQTMLILCDQITILEPWVKSNFLEDAA